MRQVIESYAAILVIMVIFLLGLSFSQINMNVIQARKIFNDVKAEVQASNGAMVPASGRYYFDSTSTPVSTDDKRALESDGYQFEYSIIRQSLSDDTIKDSNETYIYNDLYKISLKYEYTVPIFGRQVYPMTGFAN